MIRIRKMRSQYVVIATRVLACVAMLLVSTACRISENELERSANFEGKRQPVFRSGARSIVGSGTSFLTNNGPLVSAEWLMESQQILDKASAAGPKGVKVFKDILFTDSYRWAIKKYHPTASDSFLASICCEFRQQALLCLGEMDSDETTALLGRFYYGDSKAVARLSDREQIEHVTKTLLTICLASQYRDNAKHVDGGASMVRVLSVVWTNSASVATLRIKSELGSYSLHEIQLKKHMLTGVVVWFPTRDEVFAFE